MPDPSPGGPLTGIRILDLGTMIAGPFAATLLADFGAEVIKVELPGRGDNLRRLGPVNEDGASYWWAADARNKRSITLDLRTAAGRDLLLRLVDVSDVLVENFVPGTLAGWGIGAEVLQARNPRLIVSHASGFGQTGPMAGLPGYDRVGVAFGGLWHLTGEPEGEPMRPGIALADYATGMFGALGIMLALYHRDASGGPGQEVDTALYESVVRQMEFTISHFAATGVVRGRTGNAGPSVPSGAFQCNDGAWIAIAVAEDGMYRRLMEAIGQPALAADPRYAGLAGRLADREPIEAAIREWVAKRSTAEAVAALQAAEIPVGASATVADVFQAPQVKARQMLVTVDDPVHGPITIQGVTPKLSATPGAVTSPSPTLGQHNHEVYCGLLGLAEGELTQLHAAGVI
ncbi:MAG: CaiB/BaiF CoA transferase family protein [Dehalococcoidia bacterium]